MRSDEKPFRIESGSPGGFRAWANRSYPEGIQLLLCVSTERAALAVPQSGIRQTKDAERRDKMSVRAGKNTEPQARLVKNFRNAGDVTNDTAGM
jgi:hypothetical protein